MAGVVKLLENVTKKDILSADYGKATATSKKLSQCFGCKKPVRVDAVQGCVACLRSDVLSYQIETGADRLLVIVSKKGNPTAFRLHGGACSRGALAKCKHLLNTDQAGRLEASAAVSEQVISSAADSDDALEGPDRESRVSSKGQIAGFRPSCPAPPAPPDDRTVDPIDCRVPVPVPAPESHTPRECHRCICRQAPLAACSL